MSSTPQWYMAVGGQQVGPVSEEDIVNNIKNGSVDAQTLVFISGMEAWTPIKDVPKFAPHLGPIAPPPVPASSRGADIIDYKIEGEDVQFVEVEDRHRRLPEESFPVGYVNRPIHHRY